MDLRPHIEKFRRRFAEVEAALSDPKAFDNPQRAQELSREYARLKELVAQGENFLKPPRSSRKTARCSKPSRRNPNSR
jgi:peptide chain release factor 1